MYNWTQNLITVICGTSDEDRRLLAESAVVDSFPPIDIIIRGSYVSILADIPGVEPSDVCVYLNHNKLVIEGIKRPYYPAYDDMKFLCVERQYQAFKREIKINAPIARETIKTNFYNGVLTISWISE